MFFKLLTELLCSSNFKCTILINCCCHNSSLVNSWQPLAICHSYFKFDNSLNSLGNSGNKGVSFLSVHINTCMKCKNTDQQGRVAFNESIVQQNPATLHQRGAYKITKIEERTGTNKTDGCYYKSFRIENPR
jgi:hypothetical protein